MTNLSSLDTHTTLSAENLLLNLETAKTFFAYQDQIFDSAEMQELHRYFREKNTKQTQLNQLDKMEMITKDLKANNALYIPLTRLSPTTQLEKNERNIQRLIEGILANDRFKAELRQLPNRNLQLINFKNQLAEALSEEKISEEAAEGFNRQINQELNRLCSEPIDRLIAQDVQAICRTGISAEDLPYLNEICQFNEALRGEVENQIADYYMLNAEEHIAKSSLVASHRENALRPKNTINESRFGIDSYENPPLPALFTAKTVDQIYELAINGADPLRESKDVEETPLDHLFSESYVINQSLNGIYIAKMSLKAELKKHLSKESELELKNQKKQLKIEAAALKDELEKNAALIKAQISVLILRNGDAEVSHYPDIARSEKYQSLWNAHKQEVLEMKQTPLSETFSVHDFLIKDLEKLPDLAAKALKSLTAKFPHYAPLLQMQSDMLENYRLVQGPPQAQSITESNLAAVSNQSVKTSPNLSQLNVTIKPMVSSSVKDSDEHDQTQPTRQKSTSRLNHSAFFGGSFQTKSESASKKVSERSSRLQGSVFFAYSNDKSLSSSNFGTEKSTERRIYAKSS